MKHRAERALVRSTGFRRAAALTASILLVSLGMVTQAGTSTAEGNNGTVKIDGWTLDHGAGGGAPNSNEPHVDCSFDVEWYNYDAQVASTVTFEMQAPSQDVGLSGTDPAEVLLDDDDASGADAEGLDAVQPYTLAFDGEPHPEHGYHVKLTVSTPGSNGADVKHKVFWVEGCEDEPDTVEVPAAPSVTDPCGAGNAAWSVPADDETFAWTLEEDGDLVVTIVAEDTVFVGTGEATHDFGPAVESNTEECEVLGEQLEIPAQPAVEDPCDPGNAEWVVPADTDELDWTLQDDGVLTVDITVPDTVFEGTEETTWSFGTAEETNTEACEVKGEQDDGPAPDVQVLGAQLTVPTSVEAGTGPASSSLPRRNPLWLLAVGSGLGLVGVAGWRRRTAAHR